MLQIAAVASENGPRFFQRKKSPFSQTYWNGPSSSMHACTCREQPNTHTYAHLALQEIAKHTPTHTVFMLNECFHVVNIEAFCMCFCVWHSSLVQLKTWKDEMLCALQVESAGVKKPLHCSEAVMQQNYCSHPSRVDSRVFQACLAFFSCLCLLCLL